MSSNEYHIQSLVFITFKQRIVHNCKHEYDDAEDDDDDCIAGDA